MSDIPTTEPLSFRAGDLVQWTKSFSDYPASDSYVLEYYLSTESESQTITTTASGDDHLATITAADSAAWSAGLYRYQARIEKTTEIYTVGEGMITVYADMSAETSGLAITGANALTPQQQRIFWMGVRANIMDLLDGKVLADNATYSIAGRSLSKYDFDELTGMLNFVDKKINDLEKQLGLTSSGIIQVQFTSP